MKHGKQRNRKQNPSPLVLVLLILLWCGMLGWGGAAVMAKGDAILQREIPSETLPRLKSVDPVPEEFQLGQELYRDRCGTCHLAIPPEVFPTQTWQELLQNPKDHYGTSIPNVFRPELLIMWDYLSSFSRPLNEEESVPYRFGNSRYFQILHPRVDLPQPISHRACASCHPGVKDFDFRRLTPEWEDGP